MGRVVALRSPDKHLSRRCGGHSSEQSVYRVLSGDLQQRRRRLIAEAEARAAEPHGAVVGNHVVITLRPVVVLRARRSAPAPRTIPPHPCSGMPMSSQTCNTRRGRGTVESNA
jgi:hypothetical protein